MNIKDDMSTVEIINKILDMKDTYLNEYFISNSVIELCITHKHTDIIFFLYEDNTILLDSYYYNSLCDRIDIGLFIKDSYLYDRFVDMVLKLYYFKYADLNDEFINRLLIED